MVAHKIIVHFTVHSFIYILLKLYVYYSKIEKSLILFKKNRWLD